MNLNRHPLLFATLAGLLLATLLQLRYAYHFLFLEQHQLFLTGKTYACQTISHPGGLIEYLSQYLIQYFTHHCVGPLLLAILLIAIAATLHHLLKQDPPTPLYLFEGTLILFLAINLLDIAFHLKGITGYLCCLAALSIYKRIQQHPTRPWKRYLTATLLAATLYLLAAPFQTLFLLAAGSMELRKNGLRQGRSLLLPLLALVTTLAASHYLGNSHYRACFTIDGVCSFRIIPGWTKYTPWILLPTAILLTPYLQRLANHLRPPYLPATLQTLLLLAALCYLPPKYDDNWSLPIKQLNHYATKENWDKILACCKKNSAIDQDYITLNYQNLALAEKGILADSLLHYPQKGANGLFAPWDRTLYTALILQDISYRYGSIPTAQRYAYEGNVGSTTAGYPQTLKTLIRTNLLQKQYRVAAKYLYCLQQAPTYKTWANRQATYLTDTAALHNDPEYKNKLHYLHTPNQLLTQNDLFRLSRLDKRNKRLRDFVLCYHLLNKDLEKFLAWFDYYYPEYPPETLPTLYYEVLMACAPHHPHVLTHYRIPPQVIENFELYTSIYSSSTDSAERHRRLTLYHAQTYWYYYHYNPHKNE